MNDAQLILDPYAFDQSEAGWRNLDVQGNFLGAAKLIERYLELNQQVILDQSRVSIQSFHFHAGQEYAMAGSAHFGRASSHFSQSYKSDMGWNIYVDGTLAYLAKDAAKLGECADALLRLAEAEPAYEQNALLLRSFHNGLQNHVFDYALLYG